MKETVIAIFDIGKTNKKLLLFNEDLKVIRESEQKFPEITDDDGFECDDIEHIEKWIKDSVSELAATDKFDLKAINFSTYGATIAYIGSEGNRLTPIYNYLKPMDEKIPERLYSRCGGHDEFCRRTASPALGMLNSGIQPLWLKTVKPEVFSRVKHVLHFPQYLSYILTGKIFSEHTSIGCHTALWDFDNMRYHYWLDSLGLNFPEPVPVETHTDIDLAGKKIQVGIGIHDSSSSLAPYISNREGKFILLSTGTWCICMNPFNSEKLTSDQLENDCLCYMSITRQPVKSSRLFLGHLHESLVKIIAFHFKKSEEYYKKVRVNKKMYALLRTKFLNKKVFFQSEPFQREMKEYIDMYEFKSFEEAYHQLMIELCDLTSQAINLILPANDDTENIYITGGFSRNEHFVRLIAEAYPAKKVFTSEIANASALGAALVVSESKPALNLGLTPVI